MQCNFMGQWDMQAWDPPFIKEITCGKKKKSKKKRKSTGVGIFFPTPRHYSIASNPHHRGKCVFLLAPWFP
jgi:hypothetical protein